MADEIGYNNIYKLVLNEGNTLILPNGYIHSVLTSKDSLFFGGNFLNSFNIPIQINCFSLEQRLKTPKKFQMNNFELTQWLAMPKVLDDFKKIKKIIQRWIPEHQI